VKIACFLSGHWGEDGKQTLDSFCSMPASLCEWHRLCVEFNASKQSLTIAHEGNVDSNVWKVILKCVGDCWTSKTGHGSRTIRVDGVNTKFSSANKSLSFSAKLTNRLLAKALNQGWRTYLLPRAIWFVHYGWPAAKSIYFILKFKLYLNCEV